MSAHACGTAGMGMSGHQAAGCASDSISGRRSAKAEHLSAPDQGTCRSKLDMLQVVPKLLVLSWAQRNCNASLFCCNKHANHSQRSVPCKMT